MREGDFTMKRITVVGMAFVLIMFTVSTTMAWDIPGAKKDTGVKVDSDGLSKRSAAIVSKVRLATISFSEALINVAEAVGNKEAAERLQQAMKNAKENKNDEKALKALVAEENKAIAEMEKVDFKASMNKEKAKENLGSAILKIGIGVIFDGIAVKDATVLLKDAQAAVKQVSFTAVGQIKDVISTSQFVVTEIPTQVNSIQKVSGKLVDYAKVNGIPTPSTSDIKKKASEMTEE